jgi:hypothetical protein
VELGIHVVAQAGRVLGACDQWVQESDRFLAALGHDQQISERDGRGGVIATGRDDPPLRDTAFRTFALRPNIAASIGR